MGANQIFGVDFSNIAQINGVDVANISQINGVDAEFGFHPQYQAILDYATTQGYALPSAGVQAIHNILFTNLYTSGLLFAHDLLRVFCGDVDSGYTRLNWARFYDAADSATYGNNLATKVNAVGFTTKKGYKGDVTGAYIDDNWNITTHRRRSSHGNLMLWGSMFDIPSATAWVIHGTLGNVVQNVILRNGVIATGAISRIYGLDQAHNIGPTTIDTIDGTFLDVRSDATNTKFFQNGTELDSDATPALNTTNDSLDVSSFRYAANYKANGLYAKGICTRISDSDANLLRTYINAAITAINAL